MAYKMISVKHCVPADVFVKRFVVDSEADIANLPQCDPGSTAVVAEGGKNYMVNASGVWVEGGSFDSYINSALGGEY